MSKTGLIHTTISKTKSCSVILQPPILIHGQTPYITLIPVINLESPTYFELLIISNSALSKQDIVLKPLFTVSTPTTLNIRKVGTNTVLISSLSTADLPVTICYKNCKRGGTIITLSPDRIVHNQPTHIPNTLSLESIESCFIFWDTTNSINSLPLYTPIIVKSYKNIGTAGYVLVRLKHQDLYQNAERYAKYHIVRYQDSIFALQNVTRGLTLSPSASPLRVPVQHLINFEDYFSITKSLLPWTPLQMLLSSVIIFVTILSLLVYTKIKI